MIVRWMVTTRDGLWLGAWDKEAFAAYTQAAIDAAVAEARAEMQERIADQLRTIKALMVGMPDEGTTPVIRRIAWLEQQLAEARAVPEGWSISRQENGSIDIRGPGHIAVNVRGAEQSPRLIPTRVLYELAEAMLAATPSPAEQPKPAVLDELLAWAVSRWESEVRHRPLVNKNRRSLDDTWRQVIRFAGGDPDALLGPAHDALLAALQGEPHDQA